MAGSGGGGNPLDLIEICAELVEKFELRPWDIENLDRWWIAHVYWHPRDAKTGNITIRKKSAKLDDWKAADPKTQFTEWARSWGWPEWYIEERWATRDVECARARAVEQAAIAMISQKAR